MIRVRFAPSPTGSLHIGGARTALYNYLLAKGANGKFILRIEDTDLERSTLISEESIIKDLNWLGLTFDEGPFKQSERLDIYKQHALKLIDEHKAYYCFCTDEELALKKEEQLRKGEDPHYDRTCLNIDADTAKKMVKDGRPAVIRFKFDQKQYSFTDLVRKEVTFPPGMIGDFVIIRSNGMPVYNFSCVIDDALMNITHVLRAEEHLSNTLRQLALYDAFNFKVPEFAHLSILVGSDRQKLSKRHGATSVANFRELGFLPAALNNYLCLLGWSHPDQLSLFDINELGENFTINRFIKSSALFDYEKLLFFNREYLLKLSTNELHKFVVPFIKNDAFFKENTDWQLRFIELIREKISLPTQIDSFINDLFNTNVNKSEELREIYLWESTSIIKNYFKNEITKYSDFYPLADFNNAMNEIKTTFNIKGKFLFKGTRAVLTLMEHGPDLPTLISLTPIRILMERLNAN